jgi:hypothetical protein
MFSYGTRHRTRRAIVIGVIASMLLTLFARPTAASAAATTPPPTSSYPITVVDAAHANLTVGEVRRLAEQQLHRTLPPPDRVWFVDTGGTTPTRAQVDAVLAGHDAPGIRVVKTVSQPDEGRTIGDLSANVPDGTVMIWGWLIFIAVLIIKAIIDAVNDD